MAETAVKGLIGRSMVRLIGESPVARKRSVLLPSTDDQTKSVKGSSQLLVGLC